MDITLTIPDDKLSDLKEGFLAWIPNNTLLNDIDFFKQWIKNTIKEVYIEGKRKIASETTTPIIDENILEVS